jgi:hypothetical protein
MEVTKGVKETCGKERLKLCGRSTEIKGDEYICQRSALDVQSTELKLQNENCKVEK